MASTAFPTIRRIPPPRVYASINRRRSTTETKQTFVYDDNHDHEKCLIEANELCEVNRRQLIQIQLLERDYRQLDDEIGQLQNERDLLLKQKRLFEEELERSSHYASANVDLHVYTQKLENECRDLRCQLALREKEKFELNEAIADSEIQIKLARDGQEEWRDAYNELEAMLATETENRQCFEVQLQEANLRRKENENQIRRLQNDFDELMLSKQEVIKSNYVLVQNAESLREQLRTVRTQAAEVCIICPSSSTSFDNLDESLPCLICEEDTPDCESLQQQSSLFSEINSLETISNETIRKCLNGTTNDIELDLLFAKTSTFSSSLSILNQLVNQPYSKVNEMKTLQELFPDQQERLANIKRSLKRLLENTQGFDIRFRKLQLLLIASREQQQCHQAELDDFFRLVDKRLVPGLESSPSSSCRLASILQAYEQELDRLRQVTRTNDETIRSCERELVEQQSMASRCRMKNTFFEKNQRKLIEKIKELNTERRQLIESSSQKRARRRAAPIIQVQEQEKKLLPPPSELPVPHLLSRSRSLPSLKSLDHGRKSRNDSGVVLTDDIPSLSSLHNRRRLKSNHYVMHTSSHVCFQKSSNSISSKSKPFPDYSRGFQWFSLLFLLLINLLLFFLYERFFSLDQ